MSSGSEKRSSDRGMQPEGDRGQAGAGPRGVGGRLGEGAGRAPGGGYPDICTGDGSGVGDPRLDELRAIGLADHWIRVAEAIGVDAFVLVW